MCNCNQQRTMYKSETSKHTSAEMTKKGMVKVRLNQKTSIVVNGDITGKMYVFRNINDINWVDKRDALFMKQIEGIEILN